MRNLVAGLIIVTGVGFFAFGSLWADRVLSSLPQNEAAPWLELFVPFLPMALIIAGALLYRPQRRTREK